MQTLLRMTDLLLPMAYLLLWAGYMLDFLRDESLVTRWSHRLMAATIALHLLIVIGGGIVERRLPMGTPLEFLSLMALSLLVLYATIEKRMGVRQTGFLIVGLAFLLQFISSAFMVEVIEDNPLLRRPEFAIHVLLVLLAYSALSLSFLYAILYLVQSRQLAQHHFRLLFRRLPPLETLERMSIGAARLGVPLLFAALIAGHIWMRMVAEHVEVDIASRLSITDPKIIGSWVVLLSYGIGLLGNRFLGWRGRRMNIVAISAFVILILAVGLIHHFLPSFHDFGVRG